MGHPVNINVPAFHLVYFTMNIAILIITSYLLILFCLLLFVVTCIDGCDICDEFLVLMSRLMYGGNFSLATQERLYEPVSYEVDVLYASAAQILTVRPNVVMSNAAARTEPWPPLS
jgi:hypothetical protein